MLAFHYEHGCLRCTVEDSGPGIPEPLQKQIFVQGFSTKGEQRGIGLYLVRKSVEKLEGRLQLISGKEPGTTFIAIVPYAIKGEEIV
ncbi:Sensor histidine kinase DcuS [compost metagenome]